MNEWQMESDKSSIEKKGFNWFLKVKTPIINESFYYLWMAFNFVPQNVYFYCKQRMIIIKSTIWQQNILAICACSISTLTPNRPIKNFNAQDKFCVVTFSSVITAIKFILYKNTF